jgi:hypothetical protein
MSSGMVCLPVMTFRHISVPTHSTYVELLGYRRRRSNHERRGAQERWQAELLN